MKRREIKKNKKTGAPKWMVTYSDMVTLILVFFILLFSMSQIDLVKFEAVSESFRNRMIFDFYPSPVPMDNPTEQTSHEENGQQSNEYELPTRNEENDLEAVNENQQQEDTLSHLMEDIEGFLDQNELNNVISASRTERGVTLVLQDSILFDSGEADILSTALPFLNKVGSLLTSIPNQIRVEGHTDNVPIASYRFPSNWELSGARAGSVVRYLVEENKLAESRFSIAGFGETRPIYSNNSDRDRSKNRRVEIVILEQNDKEK